MQKARKEQIFLKNMVLISIMYMEVINKTRCVYIGKNNLYLAGESIFDFYLVQNSLGSATTTHRLTLFHFNTFNRI